MDIKNNIKIVIWDLDETFWHGTLAEGDNVQVNSICNNIIDTLNKRGIISSICSKNNEDKAREKLTEFGVWEKFILPSISFEAKGVRIKELLKNLGLRDENDLFIDDKDNNLNEAKFYNPRINIMNVSEIDNLLNNKYLTGKADNDLSRFKQYKQLETKVNSSKEFSSNEEFLKSLNIKVQFLDCTEDLYDRIYELLERTNQLNFTKNRMTKEELISLINKSEVQAKAIQVTDKFGDNGIVGFYVLENRKLVHFLFSCRIINLGVEQWVYEYLNYPELESVGELASTVNKNAPKISYITELKEEARENNDEITFNQFYSDEKRTKIFALGACDLFYAIGHLATPLNEVTYECNVFKGDERGVNVSTEYIRSCFDMTEEEKEYCREHFYNYTGTLAFNTQIFSKEYDFVILSFHDDIVYDLFYNKKNPNIRICRTNELFRGKTSVIKPMYWPPIIEYTRNDELKWLNENFDGPVKISPERFYDNLKWIREKLPRKTTLLLMNSPDFDFYREEHPEDLETFKQIKIINEVIEKFSEDYKDNTKLIDLTKIVTGKDKVTNYMYHFLPNISYEVATNILKCTSECAINREPLCNLPLNNREVVLFGNDSYVVSSAYSLNANGASIDKVIYNGRPGLMGKFKFDNINELQEKKDKYYVIIADETNYKEAKDKLIEFGYAEKDDFIRLKPNPYFYDWKE